MPIFPCETRIDMQPDLTALERGEPLHIPRPKLLHPTRHNNAPPAAATASGSSGTNTSSVVTVNQGLNRAVDGAQTETPELTARYIKRFLRFHNARHELYERELQRFKDPLHDSIWETLVRLRQALPENNQAIQRLEKSFDEMDKRIRKHHKLHQETVRTLAQTDDSFAQGEPGCGARAKEFLTDTLGPLYCSLGAWVALGAAILGNAALGAVIQATHATLDPSDCSTDSPFPVTDSSLEPMLATPSATGGEHCPNVSSEFLLAPTSDLQALLADAGINGFHGATTFVIDVPRERELEMDKIKRDIVGPDLSRTERFVSVIKQSLPTYGFLATVQSFIAFIIAKAISPEDSNLRHLASSLCVSWGSAFINASLDGVREAAMAHTSEPARQTARAVSRTLLSKTVPLAIKDLYANMDARKIALDVVFLGVGGALREELVNLSVGKLQRHLVPSWTGEQEALLEFAAALKAFLTEATGPELEKGLDEGLGDHITRAELQHRINGMQTELKTLLKELTHIYHLHDTSESLIEGAQLLSEKREYLKATRPESPTLSSLISSLSAKTGNLFCCLPGQDRRSIHSEDLEDRIIHPDDIEMGPVPSTLRQRTNRPGAPVHWSVVDERSTAQTQSVFTIPRPSIAGGAPVTANRPRAPFAN
ncbi:hypothetical protein [Martelella sp. HB161492]|uniref:hypothetical protein n=1 Tax=Martelella sp. HB161492 TaxID=2720726 RepID=UPI0015906156|nr:hypothetical protein [Martelella sp. HB161492]